MKVNTKRIIAISNILYMMLLLSCGGEQSSPQVESNEWINKEIFFPAEMGDNIRGFAKAKNKKVVTFIDGTCSSCVNDIKVWNKFLDKVSKISEKDKPLIKIVVSTNNPEFFTNVVMSDLDVPSEMICFDKANSFYLKNNIIDDKNFQTFLLNEENRVILTGNPAKDYKVNEMYFREINRSDFF